MWRTLETERPLDLQQVSEVLAVADCQPEHQLEVEERIQPQHRQPSLAPLLSLGKLRTGVEGLREKLG